MPRYTLLTGVLFLSLLPASSSHSTPTRLDPTAFAGPDIVAVTGAPVTFYGSAASPDDEIVEYRWDLDGDGGPDYVSQESGVVTHIFTAPGDYTCVLTAEDSEGRRASSDRRVIVVADPSEVQSAGKRLVASPVEAQPADGTINRYAVMMNGGVESRYWTDVQLAYDMLTPVSYTHLTLPTTPYV